MGSCRRYRPSDKSRVNRDAMTQSHAHAPNADEWVGFVTDGVSSYKILKFRCQMAQCEVIRALTSDKFLVNSRQWGGCAGRQGRSPRDVLHGVQYGRRYSGTRRSQERVHAMSSNSGILHTHPLLYHHHHHHHHRVGLLWSWQNATYYTRAHKIE